MSRAATRKRRRMSIVFAGLAMLGIATTLVLLAFEDNIVFFYGPTDVAEKAVGPGQNFRLGGLVAEDSVSKAGDGVTTLFKVTDMSKEVQVSFKGILPDLFREGQGVVVEGSFLTPTVFTAETVLAKHDETYMPPEVAEALQESGVWQGEGEGEDSAQEGGY